MCPHCTKPCGHAGLDCCHKTFLSKQLGKESIYFILCFQVTIYNWGKSRRNSNRNWSRNYGGMLLPVLFSGSWSTSFLRQLRATCLGWYHPQCSGPSYNSHQLRQFPHKHGRSPVCLRCCFNWYQKIDIKLVLLHTSIRQMESWSQYYPVYCSRRS